MRMMRIASMSMAKKAAAVLILAAASAAFVPSAGSAEPYSLFVDGWPAENQKSESASLDAISPLRRWRRLPAQMRWRLAAAPVP